ncbi:hypothetical protein Asppvi_010117 [Aspergillus pseudoviridinutans]|uniref:Phosphoglycerate mutase family protein n=1 Tax=Aspergillus pseudoviridinutans TaxID=1517512 RepID=A0A9P3BHA1_9EURO|nr:uncharacterized protein Asppvi_010117 [Aspergillus pseudoviridinutans]GIJ91152.1 hypothetical protein Asppvi_010117 [Aspergillus pseudoviridinutans]
MQAASTVYMIRHAEKPDDGSPHLSSRGLARAEHLREYFGKGSGFDIGYIIAEHPRQDSRLHPYETVKPLVDDLGVPFNIEIDRDDAAGVASAVNKYKGASNILICWEHHNLSNIAKAIGIEGFAEGSGGSGEVKYPGSHFDLVWVVPAPYDKITRVLSQDTVG